MKLAEADAAISIELPAPVPKDGATPPDVSLPDQLLSSKNRSSQVALSAAVVGPV